MEVFFFKRRITFNEADLITCYGNDYGYENWMSEAIKSYHKKNDAVVLTSVSGESPSTVNAAKTAKDLGLKVITFSGCSAAFSGTMISRGSRLSKAAKRFSGFTSEARKNSPVVRSSQAALSAFLPSERESKK